MKKRSGNVSIYKVDSDNNKIALGGVEFDLYSEEFDEVIGTYTTDENGEIYIEDLRIGNYTLIEKTTNKWYNLADDTDFEIKWNETTEVTVENELKKGQVKVIKVDKDDNEILIEGVTFEVLDENGNVLETITTDSNGEAITSEYVVRDYEKIYLKEVSTNEKYVLNEENVEVSLQANETVSVTIENEKKKGNLRVYKVDKDNNDVTIEGVEFNLYSEEQDEIIGTYTTDENGEIYIEGLVIGNYTLIETETNEWYNLADDVNIEINWNETTEVTIENELKKGQIRVIKVDSEDNTILVEGVTFEVLDEDGNILETITTDSNGEAITSGYAVRDYEKVYLKEVSTNENYVLNEEKVEVELTADQITDITIENDRIKGQIKIVKTAEEDSKITGDKAGDPLEGVVFEVYNLDGNLVETLTTDEDGVAITALLDKGTYTIKEISTNEWYYLNEETYTAIIEENEQVVELDITNKPQNPDVSIEKSGPDSAEVGSEVEYDISIQNTGNTSLDELTFIDTIPTDYITVTKFQTGTYNQSLQYDLYYKSNFSDDGYVLMMEDLSTTENYEIDFSLELADNEYVTEIKLVFDTVDIGFCSNENPHLFATVNDSVNSGDVFENVVNITGLFGGIEVMDNSSWKVVAYKILPETGF